jgi:hypothetical protein
MSETAFADAWCKVSAALCPLLRDGEDGDLGFRWTLARTLRPLVDECGRGLSSPHAEVLLLFEIQFGLRIYLSRFNESVSFLQKQSVNDMKIVDEVACADAAISEATRSLLSLPNTVRRRSALCLIKALYNLTLLEASAIALLAVVSTSHISGLRSLYSGRDGVEKKALLESVNMSLHEFDCLFREDRNIVKDGMVSVEGDYGVFVTQAAAFIKVLHGAPLTSEEKDSLRHTVFYTAQFRCDLQAATRPNFSDTSVPSTPSLQTAAGGGSSGDESSPSSEEDGLVKAAAEPSIELTDDAVISGSIPLSAVKASLSGRADLLSDETPLSPFSESLSPYRFRFELC